MYRARFGVLYKAFGGDFSSKLLNSFGFRFGEKFDFWASEFVRNSPFRANANEQKSLEFTQSKDN